MDKKIRKDILKALYQRGYVFEFNELKAELQNKYGYEREIQGQLDVFSSKVMHILDVLVGEELIHKKEGHRAGFARRLFDFYSLTAKGYALFDPWYKKFWRFFTNDFAKILSIIAIILSIIATIISLVKE